jgi:hypothetical protein
VAQTAANGFPTKTPPPQCTSKARRAEETMETRAKIEVMARQRKQQERLGRKYEQHCAQPQMGNRTGQMGENTEAVATVAVQPESHSTEP